MYILVDNEICINIMNNCTKTMKYFNKSCIKKMRLRYLNFPPQINNEHGGVTMLYPCHHKKLTKRRHAG